MHTYTKKLIKALLNNDLVKEEIINVSKYLFLASICAQSQSPELAHCQQDSEPTEREQNNPEQYPFWAHKPKYPHGRPTPVSDNKIN